MLLRLLLRLLRVPEHWRCGGGPKVCEGDSHAIMQNRIPRPTDSGSWPCPAAVANALFCLPRTRGSDLLTI